MKKNILVTGCAGFIGFHLTKKLLELNYNVIGLDNINSYYDVNLNDRLKQLGLERDSIKYNYRLISKLYSDRLIFYKIDLEDNKNLKNIFDECKIDVVCNLAAQAGVRYSLENPYTYINSNVVGFVNLLELCKKNKVKRFVYASSSSVYGENKNTPFSENENVDYPLSLYAATKKSNELMAHVYSHLFGIETIGLRFFTVYGPWGRPDMALFLFTKAMLNNNSIDVFNHGKLSRDFTYIDDIVSGVSKTITKNSKNKNLHKIYNIGNSKPVNLMDFINQIEIELKVKAKKNMMKMQPGDVTKTWADVSLIKSDYGYESFTSVEKGIGEFINWYLKYYNI